MFGKRIDKPGGCRKAVREPMAIRTMMMTTTETFRVDLLDLSQTGVKVSGEALPATGQEVIALLGRLEAFGKVVWREDRQCGVKFDLPLSELAVSTIANERAPFNSAGMSREAILACTDWYNGISR